MASGRWYPVVDRIPPATEDSMGVYATPAPFRQIRRKPSVFGDSMMVYPPKILRKEYDLLKVFERGHPSRMMQAHSSHASHPVSALTWDELILASPLQGGELTDGVAHLVANGLIKSGTQRANIVSKLVGNKDTYFLWITEEGRDFVKNIRMEDLPEEVPLPQKENASPEYVDDAVRIYQNSFDKNPYVNDREKLWASDLLDDDIKSEIEIAASQMRQMWDEYERRFGRRGPARSEEQAALRDPVVVQSTVRVYRAQDEQRRRLGFGPSVKPASWSTHYRRGQVGLPRAPWEEGSPAEPMSNGTGA